MLAAPEWFLSLSWPQAFLLAVIAVAVAFLLAVIISRS